jgi:hypothetical protein
MGARRLFKSLLARNMRRLVTTRDFCGLVAESAEAKLCKMHLFREPAHKQ